MWNCGTCWIDAQRLQEITLFTYAGPCRRCGPCGSRAQAQRGPAGRPPAAAAHGREEDRGKLLGFRRVWFLTSGGTIKL